jgi:hypothetical protein
VSRAATRSAGDGVDVLSACVAACSLIRGALVCRFLLGLLGDLSSQVTSAEAAAASARGTAGHLLQKARTVTPHHQLLLHDRVLLSAAGDVGPGTECGLLGERAMEDAARLIRDSLAVFPTKVTCESCGSLL